MRNVLWVGGLGIHTVPKVASTAMSAAVKANTFRRVSPRQDGPEWRFMAVRHPLERLVSAWAYFTPARVLKHSNGLRHAGIEPDMPFETFARIVLKKPNVDKHTAPQVQFTGGQEIDQLVRLENLGDAWAELAKTYPLAPLEVRNPSKHEDWRQYYTESLKSEALGVYAADVELFNAA